MRINIKPVENKHSIEVETLRMSPGDKSNLIVEELSEIEGKTLIFTRTKSRTERVARILGKSGFKVVNIHGGRTQGQRKRALSMFKEGSHPIMVATDIAGRGIDVSDIEVVVNYDLPGCREDYIHRIGRTGRNGKTGRAINFVTDEDTDVSLVLTGQKEPGKRKPERKPQPQQRMKRASNNKGQRNRGRRRRGSR
ncbi:MAG: C-terminal helicase domain-containing protein [Bdellovibrionota bacterium]